MTEFLWPVVALISVLISAGSFKMYLDRVRPSHPPAPSAEDMFKALQEHKDEMHKEIENLKGKIDLRGTQRPGARS